MNPAHKSGDARVRIASSAQSRKLAQSFFNALPAETARWKRCVPSFAPINVLIAIPLVARKTKNPGGLFSSPGFGFFCLTLFQAVQSASRAGIIATAIITPTTMTLRISRLTRSSASRPKAARSSARWERRLDIRFFNLKKWVASHRRSQYRPSSSYRLLNTFYQKINHAYYVYRRTTSPNSVVLTRLGWLFRSGVP